VGQTIADNLFPDGADVFGKSIPFKSIPFKINGVFGKKEENAFGRDQDNFRVRTHAALIAPFFPPVKS
jgi:putative ABC transport system permease protein